MDKHICTCCSAGPHGPVTCTHTPPRFRSCKHFKCLLAESDNCDGEETYTWRGVLKFRCAHFPECLRDFAFFDIDTCHFAFRRGDGANNGYGCNHPENEDQECHRTECPIASCLTDGGDTMVQYAEGDT